MKQPKLKQPAAPKCKNEEEEAKWWASVAGLTFLKNEPAVRNPAAAGGSTLLAKLVHEGLQRAENQPER